MMIFWGSLWLGSGYAEPMKDLCFNADWLFHKGAVDGGEKVDVADDGWRTVELPHDWAIEGPFSVTNNCRVGALPTFGTGWYRKHFEVPADWAGKRISVEFDGAMSDAHVWVNGVLVGNRPYGYIGFEFDLTPYLNVGGENVIAVRLNPPDLSMRWYPGAGIYRNVRLKVNHPVHIPRWGTFVTTPLVTDEEALVDIATDLVNASKEAVTARLASIVLSPQGEEIGREELEVSLGAGAQKTASQNVQFKDPVRWDIDSPELYTLKSQVYVADELVDTFETKFGIRTIEFTPNDGFFLNGRRVQLQGVCMHHDLGPLGAAVNYRATERQMEMMKAMGANSVRTSHNPPSRELVQICDRLGILLVVEAFDEWKTGKVPNGYCLWWDEWHEQDMRDVVRRDRNSPSVIMWSLGNEVMEQGQKDGWKYIKRLNEICHDEDRTRPTTAGFNFYPDCFENKLAFYIDVVGMNYKPGQYAEIKAKYPNMILYGSETASQTSSRGYYELPLSPSFNRASRQVSSYDVIVGPGWAYAPDIEFHFLKENPFILGEYIWTGFDYLGEPTPYGGRDHSTKGYWNDDWPSRSSYFAPVDLCGFPKDRYYLYQSQWTDKPMVHLLPHWNWKGKEGDTIPVFAYTNAEEVELFMNGKSLGKRVKGVDTTTFIASFRGHKDKPFESEYRLNWDVPYAPGTLEAVAYTDGKEVARTRRITAGPAHHIKLSVDRATLIADGKDLAFVTVKVVDKNGVVCPRADHQITFEVEGSGKLEAVGNGDATATTSYQCNQRAAFNGLCLAIIRTTNEAGEISLTATAEGLSAGALTIKTK